MEVRTRIVKEGAERKCIVDVGYLWVGIRISGASQFAVAARFGMGESTLWRGIDLLTG